MRIVWQFRPESFPTPRHFAEFCRKQLRLVAELNKEQLASRMVPPLYRSGARYIREPAGYESFVDAYTCNLAGGGDCAHLSAWLLGEYWLSGDLSADIRIVWYPPSQGDRVYHVMVRRGDGTVEDPSKRLGM